MRPWWDGEGHGRQASAIPTHGDQCETWGGPTAYAGNLTVRTRPPNIGVLCFTRYPPSARSGLVLPPLLLEVFSAFSVFRSVPELILVLRGLLAYGDNLLARMVSGGPKLALL